MMFKALVAYEVMPLRRRQLAKGASTSSCTASGSSPPSLTASEMRFLL
jgi:hypothetical protein